MTKLPRVMANLPKEVYEALKKRAKKEKKSMSKTIVIILKASLLLILISLSQIGMAITVLTDAQKQEILAKAPQYFDEVDSIFLEMLKRMPTKEERLHFGALRAWQGNSNGIRQALLVCQEYKLRENKERRDKFIQACMASLAGQRSWIGWKEQQAVECADRLMERSQ